MPVNKYGNKKRVVDGIEFDSVKEANYYCRLKMLGMVGEVKSFDMQVTYELQPKFNYKGKTVRAIKYIADFVVRWADGRTTVVDVKGFRTKEYMLKKKMLLYKYPEIEFEEV